MEMVGKEDCWGTFRASTNPMVLVDESRHVIEANPAMLTLLGLTVEETVGRPIIQFIPVSDRGDATKLWDAVRRDGHAVAEQRLLTAAGDLLLFHYAAVRHYVPGVGNGYLAVAIEVSTVPRNEYNGEAAAQIVPGQLTPREDEIVRLVALGRTNNEIAAQLHLSPETVRSHIRNAMEKTGARNRAHLVATQYADRLTTAA
jgi:PAS domain S-box-containing protein